MTLKEIEAKQAADLSNNAWLREMCIQLAMLNEKRSQQNPPQGQRR